MKTLQNASALYTIYIRNIICINLDLADGAERMLYHYRETEPLPHPAMTTNIWFYASCAGIIYSGQRAAGMIWFSHFGVCFVVCAVAYSMETGLGGIYIFTHCCAFI